MVEEILKGNVHKTRTCQKCYKQENKMTACGACKRIYYCSKECQKSAWKEHKSFCRMVTNFTKVGEFSEASILFEKTYKTWINHSYVQYTLRQLGVSIMGVNGLDLHF